MDSVRFNERLAGIEPYDAKYMPADHILSANESPYNLPDEIRYIIRKRLKRLDYNRYPDPLANELRDLIAEVNGLERENVVVGNGGDELLFNTALAFGGPGRTFLNFPPTFSVYEANAQLTGTTVVNIPRVNDFRLDKQAILERVKKGDIDYLLLPPSYLFHLQTISASSKMSRSVFSQPRQGSVMDRPGTPPPTCWQPSSR